MPTFAKLIAASVLATVAAIITQLILNSDELSMHTGWLLPGNALIGAAVGWRIVGATAGAGVFAALNTGFNAGVLVVTTSVLVWAAQQSWLQALRTKLDTPSEALFLYGKKIVEAGSHIARIDLLGIVAAGAVIAALLAEAIARRKSD